MNLAKVLNLNVEEAVVILVGTPEITNIMDSDDQPYFLAKLKTPVKVRCSVDAGIDSFETDEVYVRKSAILAEGWKLENEKKPEAGFSMPGWVVDFSKGQQIPIYQETTIKKWAQGNRGEQRVRNRELINQGIRQKMAAK